VGTATNAIQVRDVTGYWSGQVNGNWDSGTGNFTGFSGGTDGALSPTTGMAFNSAGITAVNQVTFADKDGFARNVGNKSISIQSTGVSIGKVVFENTDTYTFTNASSGTTGITGTATAVVHNGTGRVVFSSANTYGGGTTVNSGTLVVNNTSGSGTGSGTVTIAQGARLEGSGIISGMTTISGTHAPGNSPGVETFENGLAYTSTSVFEWELTANTTDGLGTNWDAVNLTTGGALTVDPAAVFKLVLTNVDFTNIFWKSARTWDVFTATSPATITSVFQNFQVTGDTGYNSSLGSFSMTNGGSLVWSAVPEPSSALVALLLTAGLLRRRRNSSDK
jgi:autotransporter-associated beta strand protein